MLLLINSRNEGGSEARGIFEEYSLFHFNDLMLGGLTGGSSRHYRARATTPTTPNVQNENLRRDKLVLLFEAGLLPLGTRWNYCHCWTIPIRPKTNFFSYNLANSQIWQFLTGLARSLESSPNSKIQIVPNGKIKPLWHCPVLGGNSIFNHSQLEMDRNFTILLFSITGTLLCSKDKGCQALLILIKHCISRYTSHFFFIKHNGFFPLNNKKEPEILHEIIRWSNKKYFFCQNLPLKTKLS